MWISSRVGSRSTGIRSFEDFVENRGQDARFLILGFMDERTGNGKRAMRIDVITLFPDFIRTAADIGVVGRAKARGLIEIATWNPRDFATDNYRSADERPYGGGPGMVMMVDPLRRTLDAVRAAGGPEKAIYMSPQGARLTQAKVKALAQRERLFLLCGRYEGIDERFLDHAVEEEIVDHLKR